MAYYVKSGINYIYPQKKKSLCDMLADEFIKDFTKITEGALPIFEEELTKRLNQSRAQLTEQLTEENVKTFVGNTAEFMESLYKDISEHYTSNSEIKPQIDKAIEFNRLRMRFHTGDIAGIEAKKKLAEQYSKLIAEKKKKVKIVGLGNSQQGKTSTLKYLFQLSDETLKIKNNLESDTSTITEYPVSKYGIDLIYVDCPGTSDSRGKDVDNKNKQMILKYFQQNNDIDIIFWVSKLDRVIDGAQLETIELLGKHIKNIWEKTIIIMTCSNSSPIPDSYFDEIEHVEAEDSEKEIMAWKKYTDDKIATWQKHFTISNGKVPVCLVENSKRYIKEVDGTLILRDGTPYWEVIMYDIFKLISAEKAPISLLAMLNENTTATKEAIQHTKAVESAINKAVETIHNLVIDDAKVLAAAGASAPAAGAIAPAAGSSTGTPKKSAPSGGYFCSML